jgi:catechol 2,3-dioxygenase
MSPATTTDPARLSPATSLGAVSLTVSDLGRSRAFYEGVLGLTASELDSRSIALSAPEGHPLITLHGDGSAPARDPRAPGLFHVAVLLPTRDALADALLRVASARWPLSGASDHLVSEALYLGDPDGNGLELYRDRPADQWPRSSDGNPQMSTLRLDLEDLLEQRDLDSTPDASVPPGTRIGHVHLQVSDIPRAGEFYIDSLGFDPTVTDFPSALFVSAGGYHHHVGMNTWNSAGASPPAPGSVGLRSFEVIVGDSDELGDVSERLRVGGAVLEPAGSRSSTAGHDATLVRDPFGSAVVLRSA